MMSVSNKPKKYIPPPKPDAWHALDPRGLMFLAVIPFIEVFLIIKLAKIFPNYSRDDLDEFLITLASPFVWLIQYTLTKEFLVYRKKQKGKER